MPQSSIEKIIEIKIHPNADKLELAVVKGWQVVVQKGQFKVGDEAVYIEIDSLLKRAEWNEFLFKDSDKQEYRLRTVRLRGQLSQGILFSTDILHDVLDPAKGYFFPKDKPVLDEFLGITKYEKKIPNIYGSKLGFMSKQEEFPSHLVPKTDEERIQNFPEVIEEINNVPCYVSTKVDGTSATYVLEKRKGNILQKIWWKISNNEFRFHVCSRNYSLSPKCKDNVYWKMAEKYKIEKLLKSYKGVYALQGEIAGPSIQSNPMKLEAVDLFIFNLYHVEKGRLCSLEAMIYTCVDGGLRVVPYERLEVTVRDVAHALELAKGKYLGTEIPREGIVIRPLVPTYSKVLNGRLSIKVINNDYLENVEE